MASSLKNLDLNKAYSYADYLAWQFEERLELIKGKIYKMSPAPSVLHQRILGRLYRQFSNFLWKKDCEVFPAPFDVRLLDKNKSSDDKVVFTVVQPDISIVCDQDKLDERGCQGAPDLIVEIISKSTKKKDLNEKFHLYEEAGVAEYWIVYPKDALVSVFELHGGHYQLRKIYAEEETIQVGIFDDFAFDLKEVFE